MAQLAVRDLTVTYPECSTPVVSAVSFSLEAGEFAVLCGATAPKIARALDEAGFTDYVTVDDFALAVRTAREKAKRGDSVVLSPASASFDMFKNFAERGERFKEIVNGFKE